MNHLFPSSQLAVSIRRSLNLLVIIAILLGALPGFQIQPAAAEPEAPAEAAAPAAATFNSLALGGTNGYVRVPNSTELNSLSAITIEAWVYRNNTTRGETIVGNGWTTSYWLGFSPQGKLRFIAHGGDTVDSTSTVTAGRWTHVAVTYNGSQRNFYINGALDKTTTASAGAIAANPSDPLGIGYDVDPFTGNYFDGLIDEVRIWNTVRSAADIQANLFQPFSSPFSSNLIGYWQLNGDATDETGDHDGSVEGGLGSSSWAYDSSIPHDIRIPQVATAPSLNGQCGSGEYTNAAVVSVEGVMVSLQHTATDLWVCYDFYTNNAGFTRASLLLDPNHDRLDPAQTDDLRLDVKNDDSLASYAGDDAGHWVITDTVSSEWDGEWYVSGGEFPYHSAEFRVAQSLLGEWGSVIGLALDPYIPGFQGFDMAGIWPALSASTLPSTWSNATLAGTGPARTFSGSVLYQPKNLSYDPTGVGGAKLELYGYDSGGNEALVATGTSTSSGGFSLTTNDDFTHHRLELTQFPQGYIPSKAEAPGVAGVLDARTIDYGNAGGGTYPDNIFTLADPAPGNLAAPYGPVFLVIAPEAVIDAGALEAFRTFKIQQGYAIAIRSVEEADTYAGATRLEKIRAMEQEYLNTYGNRFQFVMLVGSGETIPFAKITPYATGEAPICPSEDPKNYKYSDWLYVDLTSNPNSNGNGCSLDGPLGDPAKRVSGYTPDSFAFDPTVVLGRIPFDNAETVRQVLANSMGFEKQSESYKLKALNSMSLVALKGYFDGEPCADHWGDHCVGPSSNTERSYDTAVLSEEMKNDFLNVNGFDTTELYENEAAVAGGIGVSTPDLTLENVRQALDDGRFGLAVMSGHGNSTGVYRNFWSSDKNNNGVVDVSDDSSSELSETVFFNINSVLDPIAPDGSRGSVFVLLACSNASPTNASNLAATILADGHGPASVAALSVVTVGSWLNENHGNVESIGYYVNKRLVSNSYRLGEAVWWTLADLLHKKKSGSGGVAYDLYGDPTLNFYGNPNGQASLAPWPMGRRTPAGDSYLALPGPNVPKKHWEYQTGMHTADTYGPTPLVSANGEVIVAAETYIDVLRNGALHQRLNLDGYVFGSPALSADGTIYVMDQDANVYAFPYKRLNYGGHILTSSERYRRWKLDLGENPQASPTIGSDGYILAGVGGAYAEDPRLWLLRPDGMLFSSWALDHNPAYYVATDASRVIYVTTSGQDGYIYRFTQFCDTFVYPDVCPYNSWVDASIPDGFNTPPLLAYGAVYAADVDDTLYKFNKDTLAIEATFVADSAVQMGPVATSSGDILIVTNNGIMYSLTKNLATVRWQKNLGYTSLHGIPASSTSAIYLAFDGYLRAYNPSSGAQLWKRSLGGEISYASVSVGYGREIYVQGVTGKVMAFNEGWANRPAYLNVTAGVFQGTSRQFMNIDIQQTVALTPALSLATDSPIIGEDSSQVMDATASSIIAMLLQRSEDGGPWEDVALLDPGVTVYTDTHITGNTSYQYRVQNLMSDGSNSDFETTLEVVQSLPDIPAAPTLDSADALSAEAIALAWTPAAGNVVTQYVIERAASAGGPFTAVITVTGESLKQIDNSLSPATAAYYRVIARNSSGQSNPSNVLNAATFTQSLAAPQDFAAEKTGSAQITLTWASGPAGVTAVIEVMTFGESEYSPLATASADAGTFSFANGEVGAYDFRIKYVQGTDESPYAYTTGSMVIGETLTIYLPTVIR